MKLDREICLGGRLNNKEVLGIRFNGYIVYSHPDDRLYVPKEFKNNTKRTEVDTLVTSKHTDLSYMFYMCASLTTIHNMNTWDTSNVTNMSSMFESCNRLTELGLSGFDTGDVTDMTLMFYQCWTLTELDLSSFNTSNVTSMYGMFAGCSSLTTLNLSNFDTSNVTDMQFMFYHCINLQELRLDNCSKATISKIITSTSFPTTLIYGETRKIYCKQTNAAGLTAPDGWEFVYVNAENVSYDKSTEALTISDNIELEYADEHLVINEELTVYDPDNENLNID